MSHPQVLFSIVTETTGIIIEPSLRTKEQILFAYDSLTMVVATTLFHSACGRMFAAAQFVPPWVVFLNSQFLNDREGEHDGGQQRGSAFAAAGGPPLVLILESSPNSHCHGSGGSLIVPPKGLATDNRAILLVEDSLVGLLWMFSSSVLQSDSVGFSALGVSGSVGSVTQI